MAICVVQGANGAPVDSHLFCRRTTILLAFICVCLQQRDKCVQTHSLMFGPSLIFKWALFLELDSWPTEKQDHI